MDFPLFDPDFVAEDLDAIAARPFDPLARQKDDGTLFKINTSFAVSDDVTVYATISEGFRIGNSNGGGSPIRHPLMPPGERVVPKRPLSSNV